LFALFLSLVAAPGAMAADCAGPVAVAAPLDGPVQPLSRVRDHRVVLQACQREGAQTLAIRTLTLDGEKLFLAVDPDSLETRLERAACWSCEDTSAEAQALTRLFRAVASAAQDAGKALPPGANWLDNAGLKHGQGGGVFVTGDLCPSRKALDRAFLHSLESEGAATPVALSITGLWIERHAEDFKWLRREKAEGRLAIAWVNHSFHHPYRPGTPDGKNYLLVANVDFLAENLDVERLLIANGEIPSVFFRFPGLISSPEQMQALRAAHLIPLGADSWLALTGAARPGGIALVHPNGNEPPGLATFQSLRQKNALPRPLRPINEAP
jgi:hypothetical protein